MTAPTLILETGDGVQGSNTYISQTAAITYCTNWGLTPFTAASSDAQITALFQACYAMEKLYGRRYISVVPPVSTQGLYWPRYTIMGNDFIMITQGSIPQCLMDAQCQLANMSIAGTSLFPNETTNRLYKETSTTIGPIKTNNSYWKIPQDVEHYDGFRMVELTLWPILEQENNDGARLTL